jgi:hypothetical protein
MVGVCAASESFEKFKSDYKALDLDLLNSYGEKAEITNFVYQKDLATLTFEEGVLHLLRYVEGRPTTAIFTGKGNIKMEVPSHLERQSLMSVSGDSTVNEDFEVCMIRMADDFDLKVKEQFTFEEKELKWKDFTQMKQEQGELYFKPVVLHEYDNYFQLLRSIYERTSDGYFWIDCDRYTFCYDPNRPEEVVMSYEFQSGDMVPTKAVCLQKQEKAVYDDLKLSQISYPTTALSKHGALEMGGMDGWKIDNAEAEMKVLINADSLKYVSTFLHYNLKEDSIYCNGQPVDYYRRKDFSFIGIILPEYAHAGDTITLTYWYCGKDYNYSLPRVKDPTPSVHTFSFDTPKGFNYLMPGMGEVSNEKGRTHFSVTPQQPYDVFFFQAYASGHDTVGIISEMGMTINFLKAKHITKQFDCFVPHELYESTIMDAFNYMSGRVGNPAHTFELFVYPDNYYTMPGLVEVPQVLCYADAGRDAMGGFGVYAGYSMAKQWFGSTLKPASDREIWIRDAASDYLSLLFIQTNVSGGAYLTNLLNRKDTLITQHGLNRDRPLAIGSRASSEIRCNKGAWLFHMLRTLMYDLENNSETRFFKFFYELNTMANNTRFTNEDVLHLAEKHYGEPLGWFFEQWLCGIGYPEYEVEYEIDQQADGYHINAQVLTRGVGEDFRMPVLMRVRDENDRAIFLREDIAGPQVQLALGPFENKPEELIFNELFSVLCKDKTKKK